MQHEILEELLDKMEASEFGTPEYVGINMKVNQYVAIHFMATDFTIPNKTIIRMMTITIKKLGFCRSLKAIAMGTKMLVLNGPRESHLL